MAGKKRKCYWCNVTDTNMEDMEFILVGDTQNKKKHYHKGECWEAYQKRQAFIDKELKELDDLRLYIEDLYGIVKGEGLPKEAYSLLQKIRNGQPALRNQTNIGKRYKEGYTYPVIQETFDYCSETIEYWNKRKNFDSFMGGFIYALTIVIDKLYFVDKRKTERERVKALADKHLKEVESQGEVEYKSNYKKPSKSNTDISDFLD